MIEKENSRGHWSQKVQAIKNPRKGLLTRVYSHYKATTGSPSVLFRAVNYN